MGWGGGGWVGVGGFPMVGRSFTISLNKIKWAIGTFCGICESVLKPHCHSPILMHCGDKFY